MNGPFQEAQEEFNIASAEEDEGWDPPDTYDDYTANPRQEFADSVGMPLHERMRP